MWKGATHGLTVDIHNVSRHSCLFNMFWMVTLDNCQAVRQCTMLVCII